MGAEAAQWSVTTDGEEDHRAPAQAGGPSHAVPDLRDGADRDVGRSHQPVRVLLLTNPDSLLTMDVRELYERAFADGPITAQEAMTHLVPGDQGLGILAGREGSMKALAVLLNTPHPLVKHAQIYQFYNGGSQLLRRAMVSAMIALSQAWGYTGFTALNSHVGRDKAFMRLFRDAGAPSVRGSVVQFDFEG